MNADELEANTVPVLPDRVVETPWCLRFASHHNFSAQVQDSKYTLALQLQNRNFSATVWRAKYTSAAPARKSQLHTIHFGSCSRAATLIPDTIFWGTAPRNVPPAIAAIFAQSRTSLP